MSQYTEVLYDQAETLSPIDDDYEKRLLEIASVFRDFGSSLTEYLVEVGFTGDKSNITEKVDFLKKKYKKNDVDTPRDFIKWFSPNQYISRKTVFPLLFALELDVNQSNDFFRRVQFERSFDCHTATEAIYYFCIKHGLLYSEAKGAIERINTKRAKSIPSEEVLYTSTIINHLDEIDDLSGVVSFICERQSDFEYNNARASRFIKELWDEIRGSNGLAVQERRILINQSIQSKSKKSCFVVDDKNVSTSDIYNQILGIDEYIEEKYSVDRSFSKTFADNVLLPLKSKICFPNRQGIDKVYRGETGDSEVFRKLLVFLVFYKYWVKKIVENGNPNWKSTKSDSDKCLSSINNYLLDAGYPELYAGNPYEWIFLWSLNDDNPLYAFRSYIGEIFAVESES